MTKKDLEKNINATVFEEKEVRRVWENEQWYFVIADIVQILTDSKDVQGYIKDMRRRDEELSTGWGQIATPLSIETRGGIQKMNCADLKGVFRIIQSISSPKAEPFKQWLSKVGQERIEEIANPELAVTRAKETYDKKEYMEYKTLDKKAGDNLRDHMGDIELILTMLGEATTTKITDEKDSKGFDELRKDAIDGGGVAGRTRKDIETKTGKKVISKENFKKLKSEEKKGLKKPEKLNK